MNAVNKIVGHSLFFITILTFPLSPISNCEFRIANLREPELKFELRNSQFEIPLRGLGLTAHLLLNLPMREKILVTAPWTFPGSLDRVSAPLMEHFHDQVTVQTHGRMTKYLVSLGGFCHNCHKTSCWLGPAPSNLGVHAVANL